MSRPLSAQPLHSPLGEEATVWILAGCTAIAPILLGCSGIWTRFVLEVALAAAATTWAVSAKRPKWLMLAPLAILGFALLQTVPLPGGLLLRIAPVSAGAWKVAEGGASTAWNSVSVDPHASATAARRLFLGICGLAVIIDLGRRQVYRKRLLGALAISGVIMIAAGTCFGSAKNHRMLGFVNLSGPLTPGTNPTILPEQTSGVGVRESVTVGSMRYELDEGYVGDGFGTYIYSNHFGGGVNLTFPVILAAWLLVTRNRVPLWARWAGFVASWAAVTWLVGGVAHSRAGGGALVLGGLSLMAMTAETKLLRWPATWLTAVYVLALTTIAGLAIFALFSPGTGALELLPKPWKAAVLQALADARVVAAQVALRMAAASPSLGTGLETYETIFPRFYSGRYTLFFAHNDYAQLLAEAGFVGGMIAVTAAGFLARRCIRFCLQAKGDYRVLNAGVWAALAGIGLHSALDWNLHLPANAFLACAVSGLCASSVPRIPWPFGEKILERAPAWALQSLFIAACLGTTVLLALDATCEDTQRIIRKAITLDRLDPSQPAHDGAETALTDAIAKGERMAAWDAHSAKLLLLLGHANLHLAGHTSPGTRQNELFGAAEIWFLKARQASASLRGLPTPLAVPAR